jgi:hypothetical protein
MNLVMNLKDILIQPNDIPTQASYTTTNNTIPVSDAIAFDEFLFDEGATDFGGADIPSPTGAHSPGPIRQGLHTLLTRMRDVARAPETEQFADKLRGFIESPQLQSFFESDTLADFANHPTAENGIAVLTSGEFKNLADSEQLSELRQSQMELVDLVLGEEQPFNIRNIIRSPEKQNVVSEKYDFLTSDELSTLLDSNAYSDYLEEPTPDNLLALVNSAEFKALESSEEYQALRNAQMNLVDLILGDDKTTG